MLDYGSFLFLKHCVFGKGKHFFVPGITLINMLFKGNICVTILKNFIEHLLDVSIVLRAFVFLNILILLIVPHFTYDKIELGEIM